MKYAALAAALVALVVAAPVATAQAPTYQRDVPAALAKRARITEDSAVAVARKRIPNGTIQALELENENGRLIYSFDIKVPGKRGIDEVNVNAMSGRIVGDVEHESAAQVKKEAAQEAKEKKAKTSRKP